MNWNELKDRFSIPAEFSLTEEVELSRISADRRGHSVLISIRVPPAWARVLEELKASLRLATQSDTVRFLLRAGIRFLAQNQEAKPLKEAITIAKLVAFLDEEKYRREFLWEWEEFFRSLQPLVPIRPDFVAKKIEELEAILVDLADETFRAELCKMVEEFKRKARVVAPSPPLAPST